MVGMLTDFLQYLMPDAAYTAPIAQDAREAAAKRLAGTRRPIVPGIEPNRGMLGTELMADWGATPDAAMAPNIPAMTPPVTPDMADWQATPTAMGQSLQPGAPAPALDMPMEVPNRPVAGVEPPVTDMSAQRAAPAAQPQAPAQTPGQDFFSGLMQRLNDNRGTLLAMSGGFFGAPTLAQGARRAMTNAAPVAVHERELARKNAPNQELYQALKAAGATNAEALGALRDPDLRKAAIAKYLGDRKPFTVGNNAYVQQADGSFKKVIDGETKAPDGYRYGADGRTLEFIPGGSKDPEVIKREADARRDPTKATKLTVNDVDKLTKEGERLAQLRGFTQSFKPEFAGYTLNAAGEAANMAGRKGMGGYQDQADWWQGYQSYRNVVRNQLFGSALTATEAQEFIKADIQPGMSPEVIRKNLDRQASIVERANRKRADSLSKAGYDMEAVNAALGLSGAGATVGTLQPGGSVTVNGVTIRKLN